MQTLCLLAIIVVKVSTISGCTFDELEGRDVEDGTLVRHFKVDTFYTCLQACVSDADCKYIAITDKQDNKACKIFTDGPDLYTDSGAVYRFLRNYVYSWCPKKVPVPLTSQVVLANPAQTVPESSCPKQLSRENIYVYVNSDGRHHYSLSTSSDREGYAYYCQYYASSDAIQACGPVLIFISDGGQRILFGDVGNTPQATSTGYYAHTIQCARDSDNTPCYFCNVQEFTNNDGDYFYAKTAPTGYNPTDASKVYWFLDGSC